MTRFIPDEIDFRRDSFLTGFMLEGIDFEGIFSEGLLDEGLLSDSHIGGHYERNEAKLKRR